MDQHVNPAMATVKATAHAVAGLIYLVAGLLGLLLGLLQHLAIENTVPHQANYHTLDFNFVSHLCSLRKRMPT
jgi:hypothetical protein